MAAASGIRIASNQVSGSLLDRCFTNKHAHGERFGHILPANTLVEARLVGAEYLVEIEADAIVADAIIAAS